MSIMTKELSQIWKEQVACALVLLKDWKSEGRFDVECIKMVLELADHLGVRKEYDKVLTAMPPMKIVPR